jgi:geranylgeranyl diphosphate synthase type I
MPIESLSIEDIETMLWKKTGALYEFCGTTGAAIGLNTANLKHPYAVALAEFCSACGAAFQLQDDILGLIGNEQMLGKPVGADIREGKRTVIVRHAYANSTPAERAQISRTLGNAHASADDIENVIHLLAERDGIRFTAERARKHVNRGLSYLDKLPPTYHRDLLAEWAELMIRREF